VDKGRARTLTLIAAILGSGIALLDATVVNVALPAIENDLGGDLYGERRIFALGVGAFGVASLLCARRRSSCSSPRGRCRG